MIVATMIPAYMSEVKSDGANHLYFSYPTPVATNMVPANFTAYSMPIPPPYETVVNITKQQEENFPTTSSSVTSASTSLSQQQQQQQRDEQQQQQQQQRLQQRRSIVPVDEEARKKYRERRDKNNLAAKKSRSNRREREKMMQRKVDELEKENEALRAQLAIYTQQLDYARKEYERQLSLSYTAQQQGILLRDNPTNLVPTTQSAPILYPSFSQQTVT
uniref:BZIP domain-containing protein n=1 Tax=Wuchereria bancrofti TaxID=6293 RepID=A0A1I8EH63_WUCBA